jgi:hypothetical protein
MTSIKIIREHFYINNVPANPGDILKQGKLLGVCTDLCTFHETKNINSFLDNLKYLQNSGINIISAAFQSPNPFREYYIKSREQDKLKNIAHSSSAIKPDGSLDYNFLDNLELIIKTADSSGLAVLVNILDSSCEHIFSDEFAVITAIFNAADWLISKKFNNILVNLTNISHTFYKSSVLNGEKYINIFKSVKQAAGDNLILGAGIKNLAGVSPAGVDAYIKSSDFIPIYSVNYKNHSTKKMLENIYFFKARASVPVVMAKGDDLNSRYNSYGKNNMLEAFENHISWFYYSLDKLGLMPVDWGFLRHIKN